MLEFDAETTVDLPLAPFQARPKIIAAMVMDQPFAVTRGEWCYTEFQAGDYLCFDEKGPFGMPPDRFHAEYELRPLAATDYQARVYDDGRIVLEPLA